MNQVKLTVRRRFPALARVWQRLRYHPRLAGSPEQVFAEFYRDNKWGDAESVSGAGSNLTQTAEVRRVLPGLLAELGCRSMLDVPCGDFYWMRLVPLDVDYTGGDIVSDIVARNQEQYGNERRRFLRLDLLQDTLPAADLIFCRDCLVHLSNAHIRRALDNIRTSGATYLLTTTFPGRADNDDIPTGSWRPINLQRPPHDFPPPLRLIDERCPDPAYADKHLGLWRVADIPAPAAS